MTAAITDRGSDAAGAARLRLARLRSSVGPAGRFRSGVWPGMLLVGALAILVNAPAVVPQILHGGFNADDWFWQATARYGSGIGGLHPVGAHPGLFGAFSALHPQFEARPAALLYYAPLHWFFGVHMKVYMALSAVLPVLLAPLVFALLRSLSVPLLHAGAIGVLTSLFPYADSTRFWSSGSESLLSVLLFVAGLSIALSGLRAHRVASSRHGRILRCVSLGLYVLSVLTNQITIGLIVAAGLLYLGVTDRRTALRRWIVDAGVCVAVVAYFSHLSGKPKVTPDLSRIEFIYGHALYVVSASLDPFDALESRSGVVVMLVVIAVAAVACLLLPKGDQVRRDLVRWLRLAAAAAVWIVFAWAPLLPTLGYDPRSGQNANRINIAAAIGTVALAYAVVMLAAYLVGRPRPALALGLALAAIIGFQYGKTTVSDGQAWIGAFREQEKVLASISLHARYPPPDSTIFISGSPLQYEGIDVFAAPFEIEGAIKVQLHDPTIRGVVLPSGGKVPCTKTGISEGIPYGSAYLLDVATGQIVRLTSPAICAQANKLLT
jgi:hypothetical protein